VSFPVDPYRQLAELAEAELALCQSGREDEMATLYAEGERIAAGLPETPPEEAGPWLQRAAAAQAQIALLLDQTLAGASADLGRLRLQREAARSYAATADVRARG
jgi:hypothetical protein